MTDKKQLLQLKKEAFDELLKLKQQKFERVRNYQKDQLESINDADLDETEILENQTENMMQEMRVESESLDHLEEEINFIKTNRSLDAHEEVSASSLVKTSFGNFLVAVPENLFKVNGEKFTAISTESPIYEALEGKKPGDKIDFNGQNIKIEVVV